MPSPERGFGKFFKRFRSGRGQSEQNPSPSSAGQQSQQQNIVESTAYDPVAWKSAAHKIAFNIHPLTEEELKATKGVMGSIRNRLLREGIDPAEDSPKR